MVVALTPMLPCNGALPHGSDWGFEFKWDGMRVLVSVHGGHVRVVSRGGVDYSSSFPELEGLSGWVEDVVLDGEIIAVDERSRPSFSLVAKRFGASTPDRDLLRQIPVTCMFFDVLRLDGIDVTPLPYSRRREVLQRLELTGPHWQVPPWHYDGPATLSAALDVGLEGIVAKKLSSPYSPGRTREWVKVKPVTTAEVVVGGWRGNPTWLRSLLVGAPTGGATLRYLGRVGSGLSQRDIEHLATILTVSDACPFVPPPPAEVTGDAVWVEPDTVVEVAYAELTGSGVLRHPRFMRSRPDKSPGQVHDFTDEPGR